MDTEQSGAPDAQAIAHGAPVRGERWSVVAKHLEELERARADAARAAAERDASEDRSRGLFLRYTELLAASWAIERSCCPFLTLIWNEATRELTIGAREDHGPVLEQVTRAFR